jgi:predicted ATPase/class 3 adenylate cyclase/DNA-binding CsgD family transcriptional regulator
MYGSALAVTVTSMSDTVLPRVLTPLFVADTEGGGALGGFVLPTGTVTFLMTDIESSTRAWLQRPDVLAAAVPRHYEILDEAVASHGGVRPVEQGEGDSAVAAFSRATDAVAAAVAAQRMLAAEAWPDNLRLTVRMAVHTGEAQLRDEGNYFGLAVIRCARLRACGHGGQVLRSDVTAGLVIDDLPAGTGLIDLGRHRLKDLGRPERIWQLLHPDLDAEFPPLTSLDSFRQNLPLQLSPLIGRRAETAELVRLLGDERVVTLTGSAGVGKTRLALAVAAELIDAFPGGVWFVELAAARATGSVGRATLKALGLPETPGASPAEIAAVELAEAGRSLVILDNCEHLLAECAEFVVAVVASSPAVSVLATSREQLGVAGEVAWRVPSLPSPPPDAQLPVEALSQYDAVTLFVDRARRARPSFRVNESNAAAIAQVCHRLDGIPLAVELAAARCRHLSSEQIANELDDRFRLLTGGARMVMPRQQTLAASVEWSYDLLDDGERRMLRRLGVFAGPFSLQAAEHVVGALGDVDAIIVFDTISRLVDKSLVLADDPDRPSPYRLLETIRAFAIQRARDSGELTSLRDTHAEWWCDQLEGLAVTGPTDDIVALVDAHHDDLVAALSWAADRDVALGLRLLWPLARAFQGTGRAGDAMPTIDTLLDTDVEQQHPEHWLRAAVSAAIPVLSFRGPGVFAELLTRCQTRAVELDDHFRHALSRWLMNMSLATDRELIVQARLHHEPYALALATVRLAIDTAMDEPDSARDAMRDAHAVADAYGSAYIRDFARAACGEQELVFGDLAVAVDIGHQLIATRTRPIQDYGYRMLVTGGLLRRDRDAVNAALVAAQRFAARKVPGSKEYVDGAVCLGELLDDEPPEQRRAPARPVDPWTAARDAVDRGDTHAAVTTAESLRHGGPTRQAIAHAITGLLHHREDEWHEALRLASDHGLRLIAIDALEALGAIAAHADSSAEALRLLAAAHQLRQATGYQYRFPGEQASYDTALCTARDDLSDDGDTAWQEGLRLDLAEVTTYARRARGERARPRHGWASLTPTEHRVAEFVAEGLTNPEIGERLLMARGTVKTHLEHIFAKTGHRNRAELAAAVIQHRQDNG